MATNRFVFSVGSAGFLLAGVVVAALYFGLGGLAGALAYTGYAFAAAASVALGFLCLPRPRPRWLAVFAAGVAGLAGGDAVWTWYEQVLGVPAPFPSVADAVYVGGYVAIAAALLAAARQAPFADRTAALLDALLVTTGAVVALWPVVVQPAVADPGLGPWQTAVALAYPAADACVLAALVRLLLVDAPFPRAVPAIVVGAAASLVADVVYARLTLTGAYASGHPIDVLWILMYACYGAAGRAPGMADEVHRPRLAARVRWPGWVRWLAPAAGALLAPLAVVVQWSGGERAPVVWAPALLLVAVLGWIRLRGQTAAAREAAAVGLISVVAVFAAVRFGVFGRIAAFDEAQASGRHPADLLAALPVVALALAAFAWRRWRETEREVAARRTTEARLIAARVEAEEASRAKSVFLSTMSHELRTPLNAITGYAYLLLDGMSGPLSERQRDDVGQIADGADRLLGLVNDVLDIARIEAGRLELAPEPVDVGALLEEVRAELAPLAHDKGLHLTAAAPRGLVVVADPQRLRQVVLNLAGNAVKFTDRGGIRLGARPVAEGVEIAVADTGIGIADADLPRVFEEFRQIDDGTARRHGGTGLGLAIVRRLVRLHGGEVAVESVPGQGSTFRVLLPVASDAPLAALAPAPGGGSAPAAMGAPGPAT